MAVKSVPISAAVLGWAREEAGFTESDLAERVNRPTADIEAWEAGTAQPTQGQFTKLVKVLNRPSAVFFMSEPPTAAAMPTEFRSTSALDGHKLGPDEVNQIRWARRLQGITSWVLRDQGRRPVTLCVLCGTNPAYCHAHHIILWTPPTRDPTKIDNRALVCNPDQQWTTTALTGPAGSQHTRRRSSGPLTTGYG